MHLTVDEIIAFLRRMDLLREEDLRALETRLATNHDTTDAETLTNALVRAGKLTDYQAAMLRSGQTQGLVLGKYIILDKLGAGGMGVVYKAEHRHMKRLVALKLLTPALVACDEAVRRFQREVHAMAELDHPHIVTAYDADQDQGIHFLVMQYVEGSDLGRLVHQQGPLPLGMALQFIAQAGEGLAYAMSKGIIHRDIKPGNLLLDRQGRVRITDFGLARLVSVPATVPTSSMGLTGSREVLGTFEFMAPEQSEDVHSADHRSDIYSLGCTLYFLLTGRPPYESDSAYQQLLAHVEEPVPSLRAVNPDVPETVDAIFQRMVAKEPGERFQTMAEVLAALQPWRSAAPPDLGGISADVPCPTGGPEPNRPLPSTDNAAAFRETLVYDRPGGVPAGMPLRPRCAAPFRRMRAFGGGALILTFGAAFALWRSLISADSLDDIYRAFQLEALQLDKKSYRVGDTVHLQYELVQRGQRSLRIPRQRAGTEPTSYVLGFRQHVIERVDGNEPSDVSANSAQRGRGRYVLERSPIAAVAQVAPGVRFPFAGTIDTQGLAPGRYRCVVEYLRSHDDQRIAELLAVIELLPTEKPQEPVVRPGARGPWKALEEAAEMRRLDGQQTPVVAVAFSPDGSRAASAICRNAQHQPNETPTDVPPTIALWDVRSGERLHIWQAHRAHVHHVAFSSDGLRLVSAGQDGIGMWDARTGADLARIEVPGRCVTSAVFLPDGQHVLAIVQGDREIRVWDVGTRTVVRRFGGQSDAALTAAVAPDGKCVLVGGADATLRLWELSTGREIRRFSDHTEPVWKVAFLCDGKRALSGGGKHQCAVHKDGGKDHAIRLWDIDTGQVVRRLVGHASCVTEICPSPDSSWAISYSYGERATMWDLQQGVRVREFPFDQAVAISQESHVLFSRRNSSIISLWRMFQNPETTRNAGDEAWAPGK